jgi:BASS family bile acid:Na+ symporter
MHQVAGAKLGQPRAATIAIEIGIHETAFAITLALSPLLLAESTMAIPPTIA